MHFRAAAQITNPFPEIINDAANTVLQLPNSTSQRSNLPIVTRARFCRSPSDNHSSFPWFRALMPCTGLEVIRTYVPDPGSRQTCTCTCATWYVVSPAILQSPIPSHSSSLTAPLSTPSYFPFPSPFPPLCISCTSASIARRHERCRNQPNRAQKAQMRKSVRRMASLGLRGWGIVWAWRGFGREVE